MMRFLLQTIKEDSNRQSDLSNSSNQQSRSTVTSSQLSQEEIKALQAELLAKRKELELKNGENHNLLAVVGEMEEKFHRMTVCMTACVGIPLRRWLLPFGYQSADAPIDMVTFMCLLSNSLLAFRELTN